MRFVVVTGMSGAGKSVSLRILEDIGYFCVDNLPIKLLVKFAELTYGPDSDLKKVALGIDIRGGQAFNELEDILLEMQNYNYDYEILFLDASDEILIKRYKETRRLHPLAPMGRTQEGIESERRKIQFLREQADYIIDTSFLLTRELNAELDKIYVQNKEHSSLFVNIVSFGFKYGIPTDSDLVFDVRFMPNPYYIENLKCKTGNDKEIMDFVMASESSVDFLQKLEDMVTFLIPNYIMEGRNQLVIAIGCTGGMHRSVTIANKLFNVLSNDVDYGIKVEHRDIDKDPRKK